MPMNITVFVIVGDWHVLSSNIAEQESELKNGVGGGWTVLIKSNGWDRARTLWRPAEARSKSGS